MLELVPTAFKFVIKLVLVAFVFCLQLVLLEHLLQLVSFELFLMIALPTMGEIVQRISIASELPTRDKQIGLQK
jgi:hypothetical protein